MQRSTLLWTLVVFFGASIAFRAVQDVTDDESTAVTLVAQLAVAVVIVAILAAIVRRQRS
jgi:membrane protein DedA with SNARE-associated domain